MYVRQICVALICMLASALLPARAATKADREAFFETIKNSLEQMDDVSHCANSQRGLQLAIDLTSDHAFYDSGRLPANRHYLIDDYATWALAFLTKGCAAAELKSPIERLIAVEIGIAKPTEPTLALSYLSAANFYRVRASETKRAASYYEKAMAVIPKVQYEKTQSFIPEKFDVSLAPYEDMLTGDPLKTAEKRRVHIMRIQQRAKHLNNVGNKYLDAVWEPPRAGSAREYETQQAVKVYSMAIDLIPSWSDPYEGRARAYELLGQHELAAKDRSTAKSLGK
jgi:tetratricopeptide (TPR) repeat protein